MYLYANKVLDYTGTQTNVLYGKPNNKCYLTHLGLDYIKYYFTKNV